MATKQNVLGLIGFKLIVLKRSSPESFVSARYFRWRSKDQVCPFTCTSKASSAYFRLKLRFLYDPVLVILHDLEAFNYDSYEFCTTPVLLLLVVMEVATDATVSPSMRNTLLSDRLRTSSP